MSRAACGALGLALLAGAASPDERDVRRLRAGVLLFASPEMIGGVFQESVVLLTHHDASGSAGVIINKPTELRVAEVLEGFAGSERLARPVYLGGPVTPGMITALARLDSWRPGAQHVVGDVYFVREAEALARLLRHTDPDRNVRIFAGYAGWGAEQLADEVRGDAWVVARSSGEEAFVDDPSQLWARVYSLRRTIEVRRTPAPRPAAPTS